VKRLAVLLACLPVVAPGLRAQDSATVDSLRQAAESAPLFASHDVFEVKIEAPLATILDDRSQDSEYRAGTLSYMGEGGDTVVLDIRAKTRGTFRLLKRVCDFPNLRLDFHREQVEHSMFAGLNRVGIVAHCRDRDADYEQFTLQEYLIYRSYNQLTDKSVRVRLVRATYIDTDGQRDSVTKYMFFLEPFEMVAARHGWEVLEVPAVPPSVLDPVGLSLSDVFEFMIANTDWSAFEKSTDGSCCHNGKLIGTMSGPVFFLPYDFDWSGVIAPPYARPAPATGVSNVRQRRYWGICRPDSEFAPAFQLFNERRSAIYELWRGQARLDERRLRRSLEYFDQFYDIINNEGKVKREILGKCRDMSYLEQYAH